MFFIQKNLNLKNNLEKAAFESKSIKRLRKFPKMRLLQKILLGPSLVHFIL